MRNKDKDIVERIRQADLNDMSEALELVTELLNITERKIAIRRKTKQKKECLLYTLHFIRHRLEEYVGEHKDYYEALF